MFKISKLAHIVVPVLAAMTIQTLAAAESASSTSTSKTPHKSTTRSAAKSPAKPAARSAKSAGSAKQPITISITSHIRGGNLIVSLDDVPVFNEKFEKPLLLIAQTTTWDPVQVTSGPHKLTAKVLGTNGKTYLSGEYNLEVGRTGGLELRIKMKGDILTVEPAS